jgi:Delta3-Delta2-enoyl-CoA isomerase
VAQIAREQTTRELSHIFDVSEAFYSHPKILVVALNGPVVGLSAALVAHADFIYAMPHVYLLAPFSSLGIPAEGGASVVFAQRMGVARAHEALLMSRRITCEQLLRSGFLNEVFDTGGDRDEFVARVLHEIDTHLGPQINKTALLQNKALLRRDRNPLIAAQTFTETLGVIDNISAAKIDAAKKAVSKRQGVKI